MDNFGSFSKDYLAISCCIPGLMKFRFIPIFLLLFFLVSFVSALDSADLDYFRSIYHRGPLHEWNYSLLRHLGFNSVFDPVDWHSNVSELTQLFARRSTRAADNGLFYVCGPRYLSSTAQFVSAVHRSGKVQKGVPSPLDEDYWCKAVEEMGLAIANLSLEYPISGVVWDMEVYYRPGRGPDWTYWSYTYDQVAFQRYGDAVNMSVPSLPASERYDWLESRGLVEDYKRWQEGALYSMAKETREKIHSINPNLSLGTLGFQDDCWCFLSILRGFSTQDIPVTAWHEDTYGGFYETTKMDKNHAIFDALGINGKVIPGLWTYRMPPFTLFYNMEYAIRSNETFWIFGGHGWYPSYKEEQYMKAFELLNRHTFLNGTGISKPLPPIRLYPDIEARPRLGPEGVSMFLTSTRRSVEIASLDFQLSPLLSNFSYVGENMSIQVMEENSIPLQKVPCLVFGLSEEDFLATKAWSSIHEFRDILDIVEGMDICNLSEAREDFELSIKDFENGTFEEAGRKAGSAVEEAYDSILELTWPYVESGFADPRNTSVPLAILNKIRMAKEYMDGGNENKGHIYLLSALKEWSEIPDINFATLYLFVMLCGLLFCKGAKR